MNALKVWFSNYDISKKYPNMSARKYAELNIDKEKVLSDFENQLVGLVNNVS